MASEAWRGEGLFEQCFFQRKQPGLRVRFSGKAIYERLGKALLPWLEQQVEKDRLRSVRFAAYEPEEFRFGGSAGMSVAHDLFDRDTRRVLQYETLVARRSVHVCRDLFSVAMSNDLLARCLEDGAEVWDIWRRLQTALDDGSSVSISSKEIVEYCASVQLA